MGGKREPSELGRGKRLERKKGRKERKEGEREEERKGGRKRCSS